MSCIRCVEVCWFSPRSLLNNQNVTLTKPVLDRTEVSPLIEDNIEDGHDANHGVERGQSSHRRELSIVVDNHEDEEDENSGHKIHQHLQHQDYHIERVQSLIFILVARLNNELMSYILDN